MKETMKATKPANATTKPIIAPPAPAELTPLETALREYGNGSAETALRVIDTKGEVHTIAVKGDTARALIAMDEANRLGKKLDLAICLLFAKLDTDNKQGEKKGTFTYGASTRDIIMQRWGYAKSTANMYLNIGKTFFTKLGAEKVLHITRFTVGQILPFVSIASDFPIVGGLETSFDTMEWLIANGYLDANDTAQTLAGIAGLWKDGAFPREWVKESPADRKYPYYIPAKVPAENAEKPSFAVDLLFTEKPFFEEVKAPAEESQESQEPQEPQAPEETAPEKLSLYAILANAVGAIDELPISDELRDKWASMKEKLFLLANETDTYMATNASPAEESGSEK